MGTFLASRMSTMTDQCPDLSKHPFFSGLPEDTQRFLQTRLEKRQANAGQVILRPGEFGDFLALVQSGRIRLESMGGKEQVVESGEVFGEGMLRYGVPSSYTARAEQPTVLWLLPRGEWLEAVYQRRTTQPAAAGGLQSKAAGPRPAPTGFFIPPDSSPEPELGHHLAPLSPWSGLPGRFLLVLGVLCMAIAMLGSLLLPVLNQAVVGWANGANHADWALSYLELAPLWQPDTADLFDRLGCLRFQQGQVEAAIEAFERALALDENLASAHNNLGVALLAAGQSDAALPHLQQAVELDPSNAHLFYNLGNASLASGHLAEASLAYRRAFELDPWQEAARARWAEIAASQGQVEPASQVWQELLAANPHQPLANQGLGMLAIWQGQYARALPYLETARTADPGDPLTRLYLGMTLEALNRTQEAAGEYQQALALSQGAFGQTSEVLANPAFAGLAEQARQRLLGLLPRLTPSNQPSIQGSQGSSGYPISTQKGGSPGVIP